MIMVLHFEELWEQGEQTLDTETTSPEILTELNYKIKILKQIINSSATGSDRSAAIGLALGAILKSCAHLSAKENINVFAALNQSIKED